MSKMGRCTILVNLGLALALSGCVKAHGPAQRTTPLETKGPATELCVASERTPSPKIIESVLRPNIVQVQGEGGILGSGFLIHSSSPNDVLIVTNYHVVVEAENLQLMFVRENKEHVPISGVTVVQASPEHDLVLLKAPRLAAMGSGLQFNERTSAGQSVVSLGYPYIDGTRTNDPVLSSGLLTQTEATFGDRHYLQTNMDIIPGNSGGPAVDTCGKVLGVVAARHTKLEHVGLLVPGAQVQELHKRYLTAHAPTNADVKARISAFVESLQRDDGSDASAYFTREFLRENVLPTLKEGYAGIQERQKRWEAFQAFLRSRGYSLEDLSEEQLAMFQRELHLSMTPEEVYAYKTLERANQLGLDLYATLQAYLGPFLNYIFGRIDSAEIQNVREKGARFYAHVVFHGPNGSAHYEFGFAQDLGQLQISQVRAVNANHGDSQGPSAVADQDTSQERWYNVARARRK